MSGRRLAPILQRCLSTALASEATSAQPFCIHQQRLVRKTSCSNSMHLPHRKFTRASTLCKAKSTDQQQKAVLHQLELPDFGLDLKFKGLETDFPCLSKTPDSGPDPAYEKIVSGYQNFHYNEPYALKYNGCVLPELNIAYETWGKPNRDMSNVVLVFTGLSSSSHARSHPLNTAPGWWEKFIGPGCAIDTDKYFVICGNHIGGCYGTTGPSSTNPITGQPYGTTFPIISVEDMVKVQYLLLDHLGIEKVHAVVGASLGGMCSIMAGALYPQRIGRVISISGCVQTYTSSIALRFLQRRAIMTDPNWQRGHYYGTSYPKMGMKLAREIATITYRSGPEWKKRFGRKLIDPAEPPSLCPSFEIEEYIMHQGETFSTKYDPNSLLYISKAMDMFDMGEGFSSLQEGVSRVQCPVMVLGVQTDILIPIWQQREMADLLKASGNEAVSFYELNSIFGHDTFLLDLSSVGGAIKGQLETDLKENGLVRKPPPSRNKE
ncbi:serine O-succinyltransferase-like [Lytechinus variegatus]|uniref:serine O-succinyltransferase-like n=1 Tax=Lytechinus variegatus TaxID=7654 RepID=UPI001BB207DE|nr:serine O-succinyltransferase-like [Lytechinus variegatus]XP_041481487.1 serine O-succinyltransferase-like [Lytechinus variegatus]XP_041481674.1 serine O-succinyltransferase-like [Lytechinus variegatus]XP_041481675.1 serine O-succinyltransferase-like [Lytechinus variegatus]